MALSLFFTQTLPALALRPEVDRAGLESAFQKDHKLTTATRRAAEPKAKRYSKPKPTRTPGWVRTSPNVVVRSGRIRPIPGYEVEIAERLQDNLLNKPPLRAFYGRPVPLVHLKREVGQEARKPVYLWREPIVSPVGSTKHRMLAVLWDLFLRRDPENLSGRQEDLLPLILATQSTGNHGMALVWFRKELKLIKKALDLGFDIPKVVIYAMRDIPETKKNRAKRLGATVRVEFDDYGQALDKLKERAAKAGSRFRYWKHGDRSIVTGNMTSGVVLNRQVERKRSGLKGKRIAIIVPAGAAGRSAGLAAALTQLRPGKVKIIAAETDRIAPLFKAIQAGKPVRINLPRQRVDEDGISVDSAEEDAYQVFIRRADAVVRIKHGDVKPYTRWMVEQLGQVVWDFRQVKTEPVTGVSLAVLIQHPELFEDVDAVIIDETGINIDPHDLENIMQALLPKVVHRARVDWLAARGPAALSRRTARSKSPPHSSAAGLEQAGSRGDLGRIFEGVSNLLLRQEISPQDEDSIVSDVANLFLPALLWSHDKGKDQEQRIDFLDRLEALLSSVHDSGPGKNQKMALLKRGLLAATALAEEGSSGPYRGIALQEFAAPAARQEPFHVLRTFSTGRPSSFTRALLMGGEQILGAQGAGAAQEYHLRVVEEGYGHGLVAAYAGSFPRVGHLDVFDINPPERAGRVMRNNIWLNFDPSVLKKVEAHPADVQPEDIVRPDYVLVNPVQRPGPAAGDAWGANFRGGGMDGLDMLRGVVKKWEGPLRPRKGFLAVLADWHDPKRVEGLFSSNRLKLEAVEGALTRQEYALDEGGSAGTFTEEDVQNFVRAEKSGIPFHFVSAKDGALLSSEEMESHLKRGGKVRVTAQVYLASAARPEPAAAGLETTNIEGVENLYPQAKDLDYFKDTEPIPIYETFQFRKLPGPLRDHEIHQLILNAPDDRNFIGNLPFKVRQVIEAGVDPLLRARVIVELGKGKEIVIPLETVRVTNVFKDMSLRFSGELLPGLAPGKYAYRLDLSVDQGRTWRQSDAGERGVLRIARSIRELPVGAPAGNLPPFRYPVPGEPDPHPLPHPSYAPVLQKSGGIVALPPESSPPGRQMFQTQDGLWRLWATGDGVLAIPEIDSGGGPGVLTTLVEPRVDAIPEDPIEFTMDALPFESTHPSQPQPVRLRLQKKVAARVVDVHDIQLEQVTEGGADDTGFWVYATPKLSWSSFQMPAGRDILSHLVADDYIYQQDLDDAVRTQILDRVNASLQGRVVILREGQELQTISMKVINVYPPYSNGEHAFRFSGHFNEAIVGEDPFEIRVEFSSDRWRSWESRPAGPFQAKQAPATVSAATSETAPDVSAAAGLEAQSQEEWRWENSGKWQILSGSTAQQMVHVLSWRTDLKVADLSRDNSEAPPPILPLAEAQQKLAEDSNRYFLALSPAGEVGLIDRQAILEGPQGAQRIAGFGERSLDNIVVENLTPAVFQNKREALRRVYEQIPGAILHHFDRLGPLDWQQEFSLIARNRDDGQIVGLLLGRQAVDNKTAVRLFGTGVHESLRNKGIGRLLREAVFHAAATTWISQITRVVWEVHGTNEDAVRFDTERLGAAIAWTQDNVLIMEQIVRPAAVSAASQDAEPIVVGADQAGLETDGEDDTASDLRKRAAVEQFLANFPDIESSDTSTQVQKWWNRFGEFLPDLVQILETGPPEERGDLIRRLAALPRPQSATHSEQAIRGILREAVSDIREEIRRIAMEYWSRPEQAAWRRLNELLRSLVEGKSYWVEYSLELMEGSDPSQLAEIQSRFAKAAQQFGAKIRFSEYDAHHSMVDPSVRRLVLLTPQEAALFFPTHPHLALAVEWSHRESETRLFSRAFLVAIAVASVPSAASSDDPALAALQGYLSAIGLRASLEDLRIVLSGSLEDDEAWRTALGNLTVNLTITPLAPLLITDINEFYQRLDAELFA